MDGGHLAEGPGQVNCGCGGGHRSDEGGFVPVERVVRTGTRAGNVHDVET